MLFNSKSLRSKLIVLVYTFWHVLPFQEGLQAYRYPDADVKFLVSWKVSSYHACDSKGAMLLLSSPENSSLVSPPFQANNKVG